MMRPMRWSYIARNGRCESYGRRVWYEVRIAHGTKVVVQDGVVYADRMYGEVLAAHGSNRAALAWARRYLVSVDECEVTR